ncbi:zinc ribbon domain-containing protein [Paenibacillus massiliensis]|uniref:zinc ribbon domain-containing protein n=1 Tax=Paenibacillus massiliensis TaxID=225917 RepID=UPI000413AD0E|nr:zinc ribbon domain-containing protein [Paenibacillus massiliensis]
MNIHCQSCGMPIDDQDLRGSELNGSTSIDYCKYCYTDGSFTEPNATLHSMIEGSLPYLVEDGWTTENAHAMLLEFLPTLKRWSGPKGSSPALGIIVDTLPTFGIMPSPRAPWFVKLESFVLGGIAARTSNSAETDNAGHEGLIPRLWGQFTQENIPGQIPGYISGQPIYGCYTDYEDGVDGAYTLLLGTSMAPADVPILPQGLVSTSLPSADYAVFRTANGPLAQVVFDTWQHIWAWTEVAAQHGIRRTYTGDFELYDGSGSDPHVEADIYVAIQRSEDDPAE